MQFWAQNINGGSSSSSLDSLSSIHNLSETQNDELDNMVLVASEHLPSPKVSKLFPNSTNMQAELEIKTQTMHGPHSSFDSNETKTTLSPVRTLVARRSNSMKRETPRLPDNRVPPAGIGKPFR